MFDSYRNKMAALGGYEGEARRRNSQKIMDSAWMRDAATKPVYVKWVDHGLPIVDDDDEVLYAKYNIKSYYSINGDHVEYLLQFRLDDMANRSDIKVGSYVYIPDEAGVYAWWLITYFDDRPQFRQFYVLKCTWTYKWASFTNGHRTMYECLGCGRNQNSYNSGVWLDMITQTVENQSVFWVPSNSDTMTITYDTKFLISEPGRMPPIAWRISKVSSDPNGGVVKFTMTQEMYNPTTDNAELGVANYWQSAIHPEIPEQEEIPTVSEFEIVHSGMPTVKAGGGYKKFTLKSLVDNAINGVKWHIDFGGLEDKLTCSAQDNIIKIKCTNDYSLIGKTFNLTATTEYSSKTITIEVVGI